MFYIVSRGCTATNWLAKNLSLHKDIVCFYSSRSFPPVPPGEAYPANKSSWVREPLDQSKFLDSLNLCEKATLGSKVFGSIHGYHNLEMKKLVEDMGGVFKYMVRHPLEQVHSAFIYHCNKLFIHKKKKISNKDIHEYVCQLLKNSKPKKKFFIERKYKPHFLRNYISEEKFLKLKAIKKRADNLLRFFNPKKNYFNQKFDNEEDEIINLFSIYAADFLFIQNLYLQEWGKDQAIKMENLFSDENYFGNIIKYLSPNSEVKDSFIQNIHSNSKKRVNIHRAKPINNDQIFSELPSCLKEIFNFHFKNNEIKKYCNQFDYKIDF